MATLSFIKGISLLTIIAIPDVFYVFQAFLLHAFVQHTNGCGIFKAGHYLGPVGKGDFRSSSMGPAGHKQGLFVAHGIGAHIVKMLEHALPFVVLLNTLQGGFNVLLFQEVTQANNMGHILSHQLIDQAACCQLKIRIFYIFSSHSGHQSLRNLFFAFRCLNLMEIVFPVKEICICPLGATLIQFITLLGKGFILHIDGHFFSSPQGSQVPYLHLRIGTKIFHIHGVVLHTFHHAIHIPIPTIFYPGKSQSSFHF